MFEFLIFDSVFIVFLSCVFFGPWGSGLAIFIGVILWNKWYQNKNDLKRFYSEEDKEILQKNQRKRIELEKIKANQEIERKRKELREFEEYCLK